MNTPLSPASRHKIACNTRVLCEFASARQGKETA